MRVGCGGKEGNGMYAGWSTPAVPARASASPAQQQPLKQVSRAPQTSKPVENVTAPVVVGRAGAGRGLW